MMLKLSDEMHWLFFFRFFSLVWNFFPPQLHVMLDTCLRALTFCHLAGIEHLRYKWEENCIFLQHLHRRSRNAFLQKQFSPLVDACGQKDVTLSHKLWFLRRSLLGSCQASVQAVIAVALWDELKKRRDTLQLLMHYIIYTVWAGEGFIKKKKRWIWFLCFRKDSKFGSLLHSYRLTKWPFSLHPDIMESHTGILFLAEWAACIQNMSDLFSGGSFFCLVSGCAGSFLVSFFFIWNLF